MESLKTSPSKLEVKLNQIRGSFLFAYLHGSFKFAVNSLLICCSVFDALFFPQIFLLCAFFLQMKHYSERNKRINKVKQIVGG